MNRLASLKEWVGARGLGEGLTIEPASEDASFRRYYRIRAGGTSRIVMDAPPQHEDSRPYLHVAQVFGRAGVHVPEIFAFDPQQGFLLMSDLGCQTYLDLLDQSNAKALYRDAIDALVKIQLASSPGVLPDYDDALLLKEMRLFPDWYLGKHLQFTVDKQARDMLESQFSMIARACLAQPRVYAHRDYHSRNLMVCPPNPGILDFQDAVYGPITYDLVSLFKDAYIKWEEEAVLDWVVRYWEKARDAGLPVNPDFAAFYRELEWMGVQRHLKVLGIFARLYHRDGKDGYLKDLPLVMAYLREASERYRELRPLAKFLEKIDDRQAQVGYTS